MPMISVLLHPLLPLRGLAIWRIEDFKVVPVPAAEVGQFHTGDSYIVLKTTALRTGALSYAIHFWLGKESSVDERGAAAIKSVELDGGLGGRAPQHREVQGHESDLFLSYFRPCLIALPGGVRSGFKPHAAAAEAPPRLFQVKGRRFVRMRQLPVARASLTHSDVFILDTPTHLFQFNGASASVGERGKALEVLQAIKDKDHPGPCQVAIIGTPHPPAYPVDDVTLLPPPSPLSPPPAAVGAEDGQADGEDSALFWSLVGGFAPIAKKSSGEDDAEEPLTRPKLAWYSPPPPNLNLNPDPISLPSAGLPPLVCRRWGAGPSSAPCWRATAASCWTAGRRCTCGWGGWRLWRSARRRRRRRSDSSCSRSAPPPSGSPAWQSATRPPSSKPSSTTGPSPPAQPGKARAK